jgi:hypothetical protein
MGGISYNVCSVRNHDNPAHRPRNHTLYDIPPIQFVFQVTQKDLRSSLLMAGHCRNLQEPVCRIKEWYKSVYSVGYFNFFMHSFSSSVMFFDTLWRRSLQSLIFSKIIALHRSMSSVAFSSHTLAQLVFWLLNYNCLSSEVSLRFCLL